MILELAAAAQLAAACAPGVAFETLAAVMRAESGFDTLAVNVNGEGGGRRRPATREEAVALAAALIAEGRSVDLGLMQVNSGNLRALGLSVVDAFDACTNLRAGARLLREGYAAAARGEADPQRALRVAFSRYNTGDPARGFANGYVARVQDAAEAVVPAIRLRGEAAGSARALTPAPDDDPDAPPEWDVWARATYVRRPAPPAATPTPAPAEEGAAGAATPLLPSEPPALLRSE
ncbi:lytic transglycosylase domain-containing protein [Roseicella sp. DB1501]|uniref:lytic transglycosylase domain-containing protein n=1 Tax=Roseicella sp. DB1501 TaxID=2730925 RepID=UPI0014921715|nr:lytic transglycosylase domain-containing protein [Roseicella sp. DB1501]NOG73916.1 lytic transglycosylase domain-containing protein [Roseicella sp. DB1501]